MKFDRTLFTSPAAPAVMIVAIVLIGLAFLRWHKRGGTPLPMAAERSAPLMPKTFQRSGAKFPTVTPAPEPATVAGERSARRRDPSIPYETSPLSLFTAAAAPSTKSNASAPYGRLLACQTVTALESSRLDTPVIGLVTEDLWHNGALIVPAGAEVHGKAALDRDRERIAVEGQWRIVWRTPDAANGNELTVNGLALDRDESGGTWGESDGSAGLRGAIVKTDDTRELKLFAATFLSAATAALQDTRSSASALGEIALPAATLRNATLAGAGAILRDYAQTMREAIARDGFFLRVPSGKPFYLYVREPLSAPSRANSPRL